MLIEAESAENVVRGHLAQPKGTVRITALVTTAQISLAQLLPELAEAYPEIRLVLHATNRFVDIIEEGFDIAVRAHFQPLPDSDLSQKKLGSAPNLLVASEKYLSTFGYPSHPSDLTNHYGLLSGLSSANPSWRLKNSQGGVVEVYPQPRFFADDANTLINASIKGLGIACLPSGLCQPFLADNTHFSSETLGYIISANRCSDALAKPLFDHQLPRIKESLAAIKGSLKPLSSRRSRTVG